MRARCVSYKEIFESERFADSICGQLNKIPFIHSFVVSNVPVFRTFSLWPLNHKSQKWNGTELFMTKADQRKISIFIHIRCLVTARHSTKHGEHHCWVNRPTKKGADSWHVPLCRPFVVECVDPKVDQSDTMTTRIQWPKFGYCRTEW